MATICCQQYALLYEAEAGPEAYNHGFPLLTPKLT